MSKALTAALNELEIKYQILYNDNTMDPTGTDLVVVVQDEGCIGILINDSKLINIAKKGQVQYKRQFDLSDPGFNPEEFVKEVINDIFAGNVATMGKRFLLPEN